jgi:hypothetical protein
MDAEADETFFPCCCFQRHVDMSLLLLLTVSIPWLVSCLAAMVSALGVQCWGAIFADINGFFIERFF